MNGDDIPEPIETFNQLFDTYKQIPDKLKSNLVSYNFAEPTPIQMQAIPIMLSVTAYYYINHINIYKFDNLLFLFI